MSDSLWPHGLYSPYTSPGQKLEWVAFPFSRECSQPMDRTQVSLITGRFFTSWDKGSPENTGVDSLSLLLWIFLTQELSQGLLHCRQILYQLSYEVTQLWGKPAMIDIGISKVISRSITWCPYLIFLLMWIIIANIYHLLHARHCSRYFTEIY